MRENLCSRVKASASSSDLRVDTRIADGEDGESTTANHLVGAMPLREHLGERLRVAEREVK
jgi:hypothetical protein